MNQSFQRTNNIAGWLLFAVATIVYLMTIEATASFWDCGEFIPAAFKQQIVHPPGAPIFLMVGRMFILIGGESNAAVMMNAFSALCTSFSVLFLFWSVTWMVGKVIRARLAEAEEEWGAEHTTATVITGAIAALTATFSTSMWFSAVEAEVYAMATFFFALLFWAMTRWDRVADRKGGDRWLLFIALMVGLSGGVHLLSLLVIPALVFMYYFRRYEVTRKGVLIATAVALGILIFILYFVLDWLIAVAATLDVMFVNDMGMPFHSGIILFSGAVLGLIVFGIYWSRKNAYKALNTALLGLTFMLMGFGSYAMVLIRADAQPSINMNGISDVHSFLSYLKREQYGSRSLLNGPYFTARPVDANEVGNVYRKGEERYEVIGKKQEYLYDVYSIVQDRRRIESDPNLRQLARQNKTTFFPRMGSVDPRHKDLYFQFLGITTEQEKANYTPSFGDNMRFFFEYQIGHMFWRYFMWNFSGRQNDRQGYLADGYKNGNWITGLSFIDQAKHPQLVNLADTEKADMARDTYFLLPFILGLLGFAWHMRNHPKGFTVLFLFWLFMGIMNIINMNQPPIEPRERDYALVGAFFAWAFWVGMGFLALVDIGRKKNFSEAATYLGWTAALMCVLYIVGLTAYSSLGIFIMLLAFVLAVVALLSLISVGVSSAMKGQSKYAVIGLLTLVAPLLMASQNWDNHNRSNRKFARDIARNYLESCAPNAILFTQGDNDTYPLWYAQEVEGIREDVRIINLSLLGVDWYINNLRRAVNESAPIKMTLSPELINGDKNNYIAFCEESRYKDRFVNMTDLIEKFVQDMEGKQNPCSDNSGTLQTGAYVPSQKIKFKVDKQRIIENGLVTEAEEDFIVDEIRLQLRKKNLLKNDLMVLDIIQSNGWERPIYFAMTVQSDSYIGLQKYFRHDGMCYQFMPVETAEFGRQPQPYRQTMNTNVMYDIIMSDNYNFGGLEKARPIYRDPSTQNALMTAKYLLYQQLAFDLISEAQTIDQISGLAGAVDTSFLLALDVPEIGNAPSVAETKRRRAGEVLDRMLEKFPHEAMPYDVNMVGVGNMLSDLGKTEEAKDVADKTAKVILTELDWLLTVNEDSRVAPLYVRDLFGPPTQQVCAGESSLTRLGIIGAAGSLVKLYESIGEQETAENFKTECAAILTSHTLVWPQWVDKSCRRLVLSAFGLQQP